MIAALVVFIIIVFGAFAIYVITHETRKKEAIISVFMTFIFLCIFGISVYKSFFIANAESDGNKDNIVNQNTESTITKDDPEENRYEADDKQSDDPDAPENLSLEQYIEENSDCLDYSIDVDWNDYMVDSENHRVLERTQSKFGVTVSYFQEDIDWAKVKAAGVEYAIIRVGYRGVETGKIFLDEKFNENIEAALDNGIMVGVYFYSQATNKLEVDEEIDFILKNIRDYDISYPIGINLDITGEDIYDNYRTKDLSSEEYSNLVTYYAIRIAEEGYIPMIYGTEEDFQMIDEYSPAKYLKWLYSGRSAIENGHNCVIWQYRNYSNVDGINVKTSVSFSVFDSITGIGD